MTPPDTSTVDELDIAVVHGNYLAHGGGEVVAEAIAETLDAPIYYGFGDPDVVPDSDVEHHCLFDDVLGLFHRYCDRPTVRDAGFFLYGEHLPELTNYDVLVFSGNEFAWYPPPDVNIATLRYVHSPPRGAYDQFQASNPGLIERLFQTGIRTMFEATNSYHDSVIANSELVKKRCDRFLDRDDASVVYPPVDVTTFDAAPEADRTDSYLTLSRLSANKRIDEIVAAFTELGLPLTVAGDGPQRDELETLAGPTVEFTGYVDESEKRELLAHAKGFIFNAQSEDFGLVPVEAMAAGCPVIGVNDGFTAHQIVDGWNGETYDAEARPAALRDAIRSFEATGVDASPSDIRAFAMEHFDIGVFREQIREEVASALSAARIDVPWQDTTESESVAPQPVTVATDGGQQ